MKIRVLAWITFRSLPHSKIIILFTAAFVCIVLLMMTPLMAYKSMAGTQPAVAQGMVLALVSVVTSMVSGFGSLLAVWAAADAVGSEMKNGTIMAVMARPIRRWEFLLGKWLGAQMLMAIYVIFMFGLSNMLVSIGGEHLVTHPWLLLVYPMVRYSLYGAIALCLATMLHPVVAFIIVLFVGAIANLVAPSSLGLLFLPQLVRRGLYFVLPSVKLLAESNFLAVNSAKLKPTPWTDHVTALVYGIDYALVFLMLAVWAFRRRSLARA